MKLLKAAFLAGALALATGSGANWNANVTEVEGGHRIGNPEASVHLAEYISYTCNHCASFAVQGEPALKIAYVQPGELQLEVRHLLRDPVDLTAAMLAHCGGPDKFMLNHQALMSSQPTWLAKAAKATPAQVQRWSVPDRAAARRAIASDLDFYEIMERRGYRITDIDRCLADNAKAEAMAKQSAMDIQKYGLRGTPSFLLNGKILPQVHNWRALEPALKAHFAAINAE